MTTHETIRQLLALSAAGLLDAADDRRVRQHVQECAECAAALDDLAALSADLCRLPAPMAPPDLLARTEARVAAELAAQAGLRHGALLDVLAHAVIVGGIQQAGGAQRQQLADGLMRVHSKSSLR